MVARKSSVYTCIDVVVYCLLFFHKSREIGQAIGIDQINPVF